MGDAELTALIRWAQSLDSPESAAQPRGARLCLAEDANSGKSVFTRRLKYFFASEAGQALYATPKPLLMFRWENRAGQRPWPEDKASKTALERLLEDLESAVRQFCLDVDPSEVVKYALERGRVVLIFDAVDQAPHPRHVITEVLSDRRFDSCHVIVTGRSFRFRTGDGPQLFPRDQWRFATILGWDDNQKARYLYDVLPLGLQGGDDGAVNIWSFQSLFEGYADIADLLEIPGVIAMARELLQGERKEDPRFRRLTRLRTRCDFYWAYYQQKILDEAIAQRGLGLDVNAHRKRWCHRQSRAALAPGMAGVRVQSQQPRHPTGLMARTAVQTCQSRAQPWENTGRGKTR